MPLSLRHATTALYPNAREFIPSSQIFNFPTRNVERPTIVPSTVDHVEHRDSIPHFDFSITLQASMVQ